MTTRALIVDDDPAIITAIGDIVRSLDHQADTAGDLDTARGKLETVEYQYLILDMKIPVSPDRKLGRRENGRNLLQTVRGSPRTARLPVIVVTGEDSGESDFILSVMRAGGMELTEYIQKPVDGDKLDRAIQVLLAKAAGRPAPVILRPFAGGERRPMLIHPDKVLLCGVQVWTDCAYPEMGQVLRWLAERNSSGYVRIRGSELNRRLERNASNQIGQPIKRFRESCREKMASCMDLDCGLYDVIGDTRGGGYRLTETIEAKVVDGPASMAAMVAPSPASAPGLRPDAAVDLNPRQRWVMDQVAGGAEVRQKTAIEHFRREVNASTVKRDLKEMRGRGLIHTNQQGFFAIS